LAPFKVRGEWFKISINKINQINHDYWWDKVPGISRCSVEQFLKLKEEKFYSKKQNSLAMMI